MHTVKLSLIIICCMWQQGKIIRKCCKASDEGISGYSLCIYTTKITMYKKQRPLQLIVCGDSTTIMAQADCNPQTIGPHERSTFIAR